MGWAAAELVNALKRQVLVLETDLRARVGGPLDSLWDW